MSMGRKILSFLLVAVLTVFGASISFFATEGPEQTEGDSAGVVGPASPTEGEKDEQVPQGQNGAPTEGGIQRNSPLQNEEPTATVQKFVDDDTEDETPFELRFFSGEGSDVTVVTYTIAAADGPQDITELLQDNFSQGQTITVDEPNPPNPYRFERIKVTSGTHTWSSNQDSGSVSFCYREEFGDITIEVYNVTTYGATIQKFVDGQTEDETEFTLQMQPETGDAETITVAAKDGILELTGVLSPYAGQTVTFSEINIPEGYAFDRMEATVDGNVISSGADKTLEIELSRYQFDIAISVFNTKLPDRRITLKKLVNNGQTDSQAFSVEIADDAQSEPYTYRLSAQDAAKDITSDLLSLPGTVITVRELTDQIPQGYSFSRIDITGADFQTAADGSVSFLIPQTGDFDISIVVYNSTTSGNDNTSRVDGGTGGSSTPDRRPTSAVSVIIPDPEVPQTQVTIEDPETPLAALPQTGGKSSGAALAAGSLLLALSAFLSKGRRKRNEEAE